MKRPGLFLITIALVFVLAYATRPAAQIVNGGGGGGGGGAANCSGDINTGCSSVTSTHLAAALPAAQGGSGAVSPTAHGLLIGEGASAFTPLTIPDAMFVMGKGASVDPTSVSMSGDCLLPDTGIISCTKIAGVTIDTAIAGAADPLIPLHGGSGIANPTAHDLMIAEGASNFNLVADGATGTFLYGQGAAADPMWSTLTLPNAATTGDLLEATGTNAIGRLADVATGQVLASGGVGVAPAYTSAPTISGANFTAASIPNASLVTTPVTSVAPTQTITESAGAVTMAINSATVPHIDSDYLTMNANVTITTLGTAGLPDAEEIWLYANQPAGQAYTIAYAAGSGVTLHSEVPGDTGTVGAACPLAPANGYRLDKWKYHSGTATLDLLACVTNTPSAALFNTAGTGLSASGSTVSMNTPVSLANGGTAQTTAAAARASTGLNIDEATLHGDSIYSILATDRVVLTNASFSASRAWTLPAASALNAGQSLVVGDGVGGVTSTNTLVITRAGSDTIGNAATTLTLGTAYAVVQLISDGVSHWTIASGLPNEFTVAAGPQAFGNTTSPNNYASGGAITSAVATNSCHFVQLASTNVFHATTCTTAPTFNVYDGASNVGTAKIASATLQARGTTTTQAETLAITPGSTYGIEVSTAGGTCLTDEFQVSAEISCP